MLISVSGGWVRTRSPHLLKNGECSKLQNYLIQDGAIKKVGGTRPYGPEGQMPSLGALGIPLVLNSYHIRGDGSIVKRRHVYYDGGIYYGDDLTGQFRATNIMTLSKNQIPTYFSIQIAGNSIIYVLTGKDKVIKYDGNNAYSWEVCAGDLTNITDYESGTVHLDRIWYIVKQSSQIDYSNSTNPESIADTITIGSDKDSYCVRSVEGAGETLYVFKNNSIYQLYGRTPSQFQFRKVTDKYGLACKRGIRAVGSGFVFLNTFDKELYFFGGTEASIKPMTEDNVRLREIMDTSEDALNNVDMTVHKSFFRMAFQNMDSTFDNNNCELVYNINDPSAEGLPKWSLIKGSNVWSYSVWDNYNDQNELVTGRSDIGKIMYHNRGHNWDTDKIETIIRTAEITASEDKVVRFSDIYVKGKPGSYNKQVTFRTFVNGRYSIRDEQLLSVRGETTDLGAIHIPTQALFNDRIQPFTEYSRGNSIACEIYENELDTDLEIYSIALNAKKPQYKIRNQKV